MRKVLAFALLLFAAAVGAEPAPITLDVRDADVRDLLDALASNHGLNVVYGPGVQAKVSIHLQSVKLDTALDAIVRASGLRWFRRDNLLYVLHGDEGSAQESRVFHLEYASVDQTLPLVKSVMSTEGRVATAEDGRTLVASDTPERLDAVERVVASIDRAPRQVMLDARIIEVDLTDDLSVGIDWTELLHGQVSGRADQQGFAGPRGELRPGFFATISHSDFQAVLASLQQRTHVHTLAAPRILGVDNRLAEIIIGGRLGYPVATSTASATLQSVQFIEVGTQLRLTPHVTADGNVLMDVHPEVSDGDVVDGLPRENTTEATTTVLVPGGKTLLLGGLIRDKVTRTRSGVPLLSRLPLLGWIFGHSIESHTRGEIVVLVTPQVLQPGELPSVPASPDSLR